MRLPSALFSLTAAAGIAATATIATTAPVSAQGFGAVYSISNDANDNEVQVQLRLPNGKLLPFGSRSTGGTGTAGGLGSQGALAASRNGRYLFAVSPGSNEVSMFRVFWNVFLWRLDTEATDGMRPTSVAVHRRLVYVLNADSDTVRGFRRRGNNLVPIANATYSLSQSGAAAAQVGFSPNGKHLIVTERATNTIGVFPVMPDGTLGTGNFQPSAGPTPFGFVFRNDGTLVVSEAAGGAAGASLISSYDIDASGTLAAISGAVPTNQTAACWIAIPRNGRFAYTTNTGSGTLSGFGLDQTGSLSPLDPNGVTGTLPAGASPLDFDFDRSGRYVYVLDAGNDELRGFYRRNDGSLQPLTTSVDVVDGTAGLLVR